MTKDLRFISDILKICHGFFQLFHSFLYGQINHDTDAVEAVADVAVGETEDGNAFSFYVVCPPLVIAPAVIGVVLGTVDFYGQAGFSAVKIKDKRSLYPLPAEFDGVVTEVLIPEFLLFRGHVFSHG